MLTPCWIDARRYKMQQNRLGALRRVQLVFIVRNTADVSWFHSLFRQLEEVRTPLMQSKRTSAPSELRRRADFAIPPCARLQSSTDPDFFTIRIYLTQPVSSAMLANIAVQSDEFDAVSGLTSQTHFGRPDFDVFFRELRTKIDVGMYLPGQESSLTTDVGGAHHLAAPLWVKLISILAVASLLLRPAWSREGAQEQGEEGEQRGCPLRLQEGTLRCVFPSLSPFPPS